MNQFSSIFVFTYLKPKPKSISLHAYVICPYHNTLDVLPNLCKTIILLLSSIIMDISVGVHWLPNNIPIHFDICTTTLTTYLINKYDLPIQFTKPEPQLNKWCRYFPTFAKIHNHSYSWHYSLHSNCYHL